jgi:hypothetical protein
MNIILVTKKQCLKSVFDTVFEYRLKPLKNEINNGI